MKLKLTREQQIPEGYKEFPTGSEKLCTVYTNIEQPHKPKAIFFTGKQSKKTWHYSFTDIERMKEQINETINSLKSWEERKVERKAQKKLAMMTMDTSAVKVGDIFHWSGGYNCTRNDYVKVVGFTGKNKVEVVELGKTQISGDWMNGEVAPVIESEGKRLQMVIRPSWMGGGQVMLRNPKTSYRDDYLPWNGKPNWENCD